MAKALAHRQSFAHHLFELRNRLLVWLLTLIGAGVGAYAWREVIFEVVQRPLKQELFYTSPGGGFVFFMTISLLVGFVISIPVLIYEFIRFIEPAMPQKVGKRIGNFILASVLLAATGVSFAYLVSLPATLNFLTEFGGDTIRPLISANEYLHFIVAYLGGFALAFQLPLVLLIINKFSPLTTKKLGAYRRYFAIFAVIIAAVLTPTPDPVNQFIMAAPMLLLYEVSIPLVAFDNRHTRKHIATKPKRA